PVAFLLYSPFAVVLMLTHIYTPFVFLPIYAALEHIPRPLVEASHDLGAGSVRSEEHTSELQSRRDLVCRLLLEKKNDAPSNKLRRAGRGQPKNRRTPRVARGRLAHQGESGCARYGTTAVRTWSQPAPGQATCGC